MKKKIITDVTGKYLYYYVGTWKRPVIISFKRLK